MDTTPGTETHEPAEPINWPDGHVSVTRSSPRAEQEDGLTMENVNVTLTDDTAGECMAVSLASTRHFLHSSTARELSNMLLALNGLPVVITVHGVTHNLGGATARTLSRALLTRINEWNQVAVANGVMPV